MSSGFSLEKGQMYVFVVPAARYSNILVNFELNQRNNKRKLFLLVFELNYQKVVQQFCLDE